MEVVIDKNIKNEKAFWGIKVAAIINIVIILNKILSYLLDGSTMKLHYGDNNVTDKIMLTLLIPLIFEVIMLLISSIGLFINKSWGWWVGESYYFSKIVDTILGYFSVMYINKEVAQSMQYLIYSFFIVITSILLFICIFNKKTRSYFSIKLSNIKLLIIFFLISIGIILLKSILLTTILN